MDILQETKENARKTFLGHVFSSAEEDKAEIFNVIQYAIYALIPIIALNKLIQRFVPEADPDKSSLELLLEIFIQIIVIFCGIIVIHRVITYFPTYSGFKYENLTLTNVILAFLVIVLSIQSKLGTKANILVDRIMELWDGSSGQDTKKSMKGAKRVSQPLSSHIPSQADFLDNSMMQGDLFPPGPAVQKSTDIYSQSGGAGVVDYSMPSGPVAANALLGSAFGAY